MKWRPKNWEENHPYIVEPHHYIVEPQHTAFEEGADAMLDALRDELRKEFMAVWNSLESLEHEDNGHNSNRISQKG